MKRLVYVVFVLLTVWMFYLTRRGISEQSVPESAAGVTEQNSGQKNTAHMAAENL